MKNLLRFSILIFTAVGADGINQDRTGPEPQAAVSAPRYVTVDFPGASETTVNGINAGGDVVGIYVDAFMSVHGFLRSANGKFTSIDPPSSVQSGAFIGINKSGEIVGAFQDPAL